MEGAPKMTALSIAAMNGRDDVTAVLLAKGACAKGARGRTPPLFLAVAGMPAANAVKGVLKLIADGPFDDVGAPDLPRNDTVKRTAAVRQLLAARTDADAAEPWAKMTPLVIAALSGSEHIVKELLDAGASCSKKAQDVSAVFGAAAAGQHHVIDQLLLAVGSKALSLIDEQDDRSYAPLHIAAIKGHREAVDSLLRHGADVNAAGKCGRTPLFSAAAKGNRGIWKDLLKGEADLNKAAEDGFTPLMAAIQNEQWDLVKGYIEDAEPKADGDLQTIINASSRAGITPLHLAAAQQQYDVVGLLLKNGASPLAETSAGVLPRDMLGAGSQQSGDQQHLKELRGLLDRATTTAELVAGGGLKDMLNAISIVAVLLVTVTFVGVLNPPGGPTPDSGYIR